MLQVLTTRQAAKLKRMVKGHAGAHEGAACEEAQAAARKAALSERCSARVTPCPRRLTAVSKA